MNKKLATVKHNLRLWNRSSFGNIQTNIDNIKVELEITNKRARYSNKAADLAKLRKDLSIWYATKEKFWKDKSRDQNIALGDRNTRYFHNKAKQRFRRNRIEIIKNDKNEWLDNRKDTSERNTDHFKKIATSVTPEMDQNMINLIPSCITQIDDDMLCTTPFEHEIKHILFSCNLTEVRVRKVSHLIFFNKIGKP